MALSQFSITHAKPKTRPYMMSDGDGLHLRVDKSGSKLWRLRYRFDGKANMVSLGSFPDVSLLDARKKRNEAKRLLASGINPSLSRKMERLTAAAEARNSRNQTVGTIGDMTLVAMRLIASPKQFADVRALENPIDIVGTAPPDCAQARS